MITDLTKRIEEILKTVSSTNDYSRQVVAEAIIQLLIAEGLLSSLNDRKRKRA